MSAAWATTPETAAWFAGRLVLSVPEAGALLGLGRSASYAAAGRGELPTISLGRRLVVPVIQLRRLLDGDHEPKPGETC